MFWLSSLGKLFVSDCCIQHMKLFVIKYFKFFLEFRKRFNRKWQSRFSCKRDWRGSKIELLRHHTTSFSYAWKLCLSRVKVTKETLKNFLVWYFPYTLKGSKTFSEFLLSDAREFEESRKILSLAEQSGNGLQMYK